jgi:hypothetical protein
MSIFRVAWTLKKTNHCVLDTIGNEMILRKQMTQRKISDFGQVILSNGLSKEIIQGAIDGKNKNLV